MSVAMLELLYPLLHTMASAADLVPMVWWLPIVLCFTMIGMISSCVHSVWVVWRIVKVFWRVLCTGGGQLAAQLDSHYNAAARVHND